MELNKDKKAKKMGLPAKKASALHSAEDAINDITSTLNIRETMLAAILRVTERTLANWKDKNLEDLLNSRGKSLSALHYVILKAKQSKIKNNQIMTLLDAPFYPDTDESGCILSFIVEEVESKALNVLIDKQIGDFLQNKL